MMRKILFLVALLGLIATAVLVQDRERPAALISAATPAVEPASPAQPFDAVQVRHAFITIAAPPPVRTRVAAKVTPKHASSPRRLERAGGGPTLLEKARRAIVGDGRHRPEPFPRVRDH